MSYRDKKPSNDSDVFGLSLDVETIRRYQSKRIPLHPKQQQVLDDLKANQRSQYADA